MILALLLLLGVRPVGAALADYSPGSHERFIEEVENGQARQYERVMAGYRKAMRARPEDARLAVECLRFIEHFWYSEDAYIEASEADYDELTALIDERFPEAPAKILYDLENSWDDDFRELVGRHQVRSLAWADEDRAQFDFLVAQHEHWNGQPFSALTPAEAAFRRHPKVEYGLLLAEVQKALEHIDACRGTLAHPIFGEGTAWQRKQMFDLYCGIGATEEARSVYEELRASAPEQLNDEDTFQFLVTTGDLEAAREALYAVERNEWNTEYQNRRRFDFEMEHGDFAGADRAYRELRSTGWQVDPFLRQRLRMFWRFGEVALSGSDVVGLLIVLLSIGLGVLLPLLVLVPVHYWGLLRERAGKVSGFILGGPGLRGTWVVLALAVVLEFGYLWLYYPETLTAWLNDEEVETVATISFGEALCGEGSNLLLLAVMLGFFWRYRAWRLLGHGELGLGPGCGIGVGSFLGLRFLTAIVTLMWTAFTAQGAPMTEAHLRALHEGGGPLLLIGGVAVLTPIVEELLFRGFLLGASARYIPFFWANLLQALLFAAVHEDQHIFLFYVAFGLIAGFLTKVSRGLAPAMIFHATNNLLAAVVLMVRWS